MRLVPRGGRARIEGIIQWDGHACLKVRVAAPPVDGAANDAPVGLLARTLNVPRSSVTLTAGERSRVKRLTLLGDGLVERLERLLNVPPRVG